MGVSNLWVLHYTQQIKATEHNSRLVFPSSLPKPNLAENPHYFVLLPACVQKITNITLISLKVTNGTLIYLKNN
jgi:hypothetical protein